MLSSAILFRYKGSKGCCLPSVTVELRRGKTIPESAREVALLLEENLLNLDAVSPPSSSSSCLFRWAIDTKGFPPNSAGQPPYKTSGSCFKLAQISGNLIHFFTLSRVEESLVSRGIGCFSQGTIESRVEAELIEGMWLGGREGESSGDRERERCRFAPGK